MKLGSDKNGEFTFIDCLAIVGFMVGLENLSENLTQSDKQDLQNQLSEQFNKALTEVHSHLQEQDRQIKEILEVLKNDL